MLTLLLDAREIERVREQRGNRLMWVYSRRRALEGPIVDLDLCAERLILRDEDFT